MKYININVTRKSKIEVSFCYNQNLYYNQTEKKTKMARTIRSVIQQISGAKKRFLGHSKANVL